MPTAKITITDGRFITGARTEVVATRDTSADALAAAVAAIGPQTGTKLGDLMQRVRVFARGDVPEVTRTPSPLASAAAFRLSPEAVRLLNVAASRMAAAFGRAALATAVAGARELGRQIEQARPKLSVPKPIAPALGAPWGRDLAGGLPVLVSPDDYEAWNTEHPERTLRQSGIVHMEMETAQMFRGWRDLRRAALKDRDGGPR